MTNLLGTPCPKCASKLYTAFSGKGEVPSCFECGYNPVKYCYREPFDEESLDAEVVGEPIPATGQLPSPDAVAGKGFTPDLTSLVLSKYVHDLTGGIPAEHADELGLN